MSCRAHSYIGDSGRRQITSIRALPVALAMLALGGCASGGGLSFDQTSTGSIAAAGAARPILASAVVVDQADPSDWDAIRSTIEGAPETADRLEWSNKRTGSAGSIALSAVSPAACRPFAVTINDMRGVRRYRGGACTVADGHAQLRNVIADDATLL